MKKVLGMWCACLLLVSSVGTGIQVQAENGAATNGKTEIETRNMFGYESLEESRRVSVVKADSETSWRRENVPEEEIDETSRMIYDGAVNVRITLPEEKQAGDTAGQNETSHEDEKEEDTAEKADDAEKNKEENKDDEGNEDEGEEENDYDNYTVTVWHNGTEIWHASVEKEETLDFICKISGWEWKEETQSYELLVSCYAEGDYQIAIEKIRKTDRKEEDEVKCIGKSATVTVDRTPPEAFLSWRKNERPSEDRPAGGAQLVELAIRDANFRPSEVEWNVFTKRIDREETDSEKYWTDATASSLTKWSDWERDKQEPNLWHATALLYTDGNYQMELNYTDLAGHRLQKTCMGNLVIDTVSPLLTVDSPTPIQKRNGKAYYAEEMEMILTVTEVNFRPEEFVFSMMRNGVAEEVQTEWKQIGAGQYQYVLPLEKEGEYEIQAFYVDPYGNEMEPYHSEQLVIDQTAPEINVSGIQADSAGKTTISDAILYVRDAGGNLNPETMQPMLKRVVAGEDGAYLTEEVLLATPVKDSETGVWSYRIPELTEDGIYTLTCQAEDYSGNKVNGVKTEDGMLHQKVKFSVNRRGSVFEVDDTAIELADRYYIYMVDSDVEIREVNTDLIEQYAVRLNGTLLQEGKDFITNATTEDGAWSMRRYMVKKELFTKEGEYDLVVESQDKAGTRAYSDVKKMKLSWVVDQSAPTVLLADLEADRLYETEEQRVTAMPLDEGGKVKTFQVSVLDALGENRQMLVNLTGEKLEQYLKAHDGRVQFTIPEGVEQQVEILCADQAWKKDGSTNEYHEVIKGVSVAKNQQNLRRMKRDMEKKLREDAEQSEEGSNIKAQKKNPTTTVMVVATVIGAVCCAAVLGERKKDRDKKDR